MLLGEEVSQATTLPYADGYVGKLQQYKVHGNESLIEIARRFDLGFNEITAANPGVDPFVPGAGSILTIPTAWILPTVPTRPALVINLPEYRLYYFPRRQRLSVITYPLGIGDQGAATPYGSFSVVEKLVRPSWHVPKSIRRERPDLPEVVPPGARNPMGSHALRLSLESILIHGTNRPWGIGRRSSHGCLRLYPEDIAELFRAVPKGTRVLIINQPVKIGTRGKKIYLEAHRAAEGGQPSVGQVMHRLARMNLLIRSDFAKIVGAIGERKGIPVDVTLSLTEPPPYVIRKARRGK